MSLVRAITDLDDASLATYVVAAGGRPFQARQVAHWLYRHGVESWEGCRNLSRPLRAKLASSVPLRSTRVARTDTAGDGTTKALVALADGEHVEMVIIPDDERTTLCVSSQAGCPVACVFCASGLDGVRRNLSAGEIVEQVLHARALLLAAGSARSLTNLVVMGMGEPMLNLDNLLPALARIHTADGINLGARRITVSTSGYPDRIARFARVDAAYNLAISLHAADDELRRRLVPTARHSVAELVAAARDFFACRGREVTFEAVLLAGVNDRRTDALAMVSALGGFPCTVNLIPWNPVEEISGLARPSEATVDAFAASLRAGGLNVTVRRQRGADRSAACGQLRLRHTPAPHTRTPP
ncbi:MAG: 23S rRNA (adenine(2503)-C(2))-methyltransferase RlmN [Planctomycetota bacterium]